MHVNDFFIGWCSRHDSYLGSIDMHRSVICPFDGVVVRVCCDTICEEAERKEGDGEGVYD